MTVILSKLFEDSADLPSPHTHKASLMVNPFPPPSETVSYHALYLYGTLGLISNQRVDISL